ncbi:TolC family protein [Calditrichota bacterium]
MLSLKDALLIAEKNDTELMGSRYDVQTSDVSVREATSAALPIISFSSSFNHFIETPSTYIPAFEESVRFSTYNDLATDLHLAQPIWLAGKVGMALDAAKTYRKLARETEQSTRSMLKSRTTANYFGLQLARGVYDVTKEGLEQARKHARTVENMYDVGMASEFDLLRASVEVKNIEPQLSYAEQNLSLAYVSLSNSLNIAFGDTIILTDELKMDIPKVSTEDLLERARRNRPEFRLLDLQERLDGLSIKNEQRSLYWPSFFFDMNYRWQVSDDKLDAFTTDSTWQESLNYTLSLQLPIFDGFATPARIQKAKIGLRRTKLKRLQLEQGVRLEVTQIQTELKRAKDLVESMTAGVELAQKAFEIAEVRYEQGISTELELLDAQLAVQNSKVGLLKGLYDLRVAHAEYNRIIENDTDLGGDK